MLSENCKLVLFSSVETLIDKYINIAITEVQRIPHTYNNFYLVRKTTNHDLR